jgi:hypothetical protein
LILQNHILWFSFMVKAKLERLVPSPHVESVSKVDRN